MDAQKCNPQNARLVRPDKGSIHHFRNAAAPRESGGLRPCATAMHLSVGSSSKAWILPLVLASLQHSARKRLKLMRPKGGYRANLRNIL